MLIVKIWMFDVNCKKFRYLMLIVKIYMFDVNYKNLDV